MKLQLQIMYRSHNSINRTPFQGLAEDCNTTSPFDMLPATATYVKFNCVADWHKASNEFQDNTDFALEKAFNQG